MVLILYSKLIGYLYYILYLPILIYKYPYRDPSHNKFRKIEFTHFHYNYLNTNT